MKIIFGVVLAALASPALAEQAQCKSGIAGPMIVANWEAERVEFGDRGIIKYPLTNTLDGDVIALEGSVTLLDPLDRELISFPMPHLPDFLDKTLVGEWYTMAYKLDGIERLPYDLIKIVACTRRVAYADGTTQEFGN